MPGKRIAFDEDTLNKLNELGRDRMATFQEFADEAFADLLKKHGVPIDLRDALRKSARAIRPKPAPNRQQANRSDAHGDAETLRASDQPERGAAVRAF